MRCHSSNISCLMWRLDPWRYLVLVFSGLGLMWSYGLCWRALSSERRCDTSCSNLPEDCVEPQHIVTQTWRLFLLKLHIMLNCGCCFLPWNVCCSSSGVRGWGCLGSPRYVNSVLGWKTPLNVSLLLWNSIGACYTWCSLNIQREVKGHGFMLPKRAAPLTVL